jgi:hypothetical protein
MSIKSKHWDCIGIASDGMEWSGTLRIKAASKADCYYINDTEMSFMTMLHGWNWLHSIERIAWRGVGCCSSGQLYRRERPGSYDSV